jgi:flavorubredoxin
MERVFEVSKEIAVLPSNIPIPDMGVLPINAFVIKAKEPVLVDTGLGVESEGFMKALESVIDPKELRWVWLTHDDLDHTGSLQRVLEAAPKARLAANPLAPMRMNTAWPVPMDRVNFVNPGDSIWAGDRKLTAVRPPVFDNPLTTGIYDEKSGVFFSADSFGAILPGAAQNASEYSEEELAQGMTVWATADSPWLHMADQRKFEANLDRIRKIGPNLILSTHLPPAKGKLEQFLKTLAGTPSAEPFVGPNQAYLESLLARMKEGSGAAAR